MFALPWQSAAGTISSYCLVCSVHRPEQVLLSVWQLICWMAQHVLQAFWVALVFELPAVLLATWGAAGAGVVWAVQTCIAVPRTHWINDMRLTLTATGC
jgi:hypothetical protein